MGLFQKLVRVSPPTVANDFYRRSYEEHAKLIHNESVIGGGDFDLVGRLELSALKLAGLRHNHHLLDFGCGIGRLAVHAVPFLFDGRFTGLDISEALLRQAEKRSRTLPKTNGTAWLVEDRLSLKSLNDNSIDVAAAFSVFTHIEAEDTLQYLRSLRRIIRPGGVLVFSHLLIEENGEARQIFLESSSHEIGDRYSRVRNVVTSRTMMDAIAEMSGWTVERWIRHDESAFFCEVQQQHMGLGQAVCFLR